jgi:endonuclease/exonuclease/phosphatase family metal-dependent hydrolase
VRWLRHILMVILIGLNALLFTGCVTSKISRIDYTEREPVVSNKKELSVMTWNIAHGRGLKFHQANIRDKEELYRNLDGICQTISEARPDIVGFTEMDFKSSWNFKVDQLDYIAEKCGYSYTARVVTHVFHLGIYQVKFGDAIMSKYPIKNISSGYFRDGDDKKLIATRKYALARIDTPHGELDVIHVHLSPFSGKKRLVQMEKLAEISNDNMVIMGDFNLTPLHHPMKYDHEAWNALMDTENFNEFKLEWLSKDMLTFRSYDPRKILDYIFVGKQFEVLDYKVIKVKWADHRPVISTIKRR